MLCVNWAYGKRRFKQYASKKQLLSRPLFKMIMKNQLEMCRTCASLFVFPIRTCSFFLFQHFQLIFHMQHNMHLLHLKKETGLFHATIKADVLHVQPPPQPPHPYFLHCFIKDTLPAFKLNIWH